jgi:hypothetical protein
MLGVDFRFRSWFRHQDVGVLCRVHGRLGFDLRFATKDGRAHPNSRTAKASHACGDRGTTLPLLFIRVECLLPCGFLALDLRVFLLSRYRLRILLRVL